MTRDRKPSQPIPPPPPSGLPFVRLYVDVTYRPTGAATFGPFTHPERAELCVIALAGRENVQHAEIR